MKRNNKRETKNSIKLPRARVISICTPYKQTHLYKYTLKAENAVCVCVCSGLNTYKEVFYICVFPCAFVFERTRFSKEKRQMYYMRLWAQIRLKSTECCGRRIWSKSVRHRQNGTDEKEETEREIDRNERKERNEGGKEARS